MLQDSRLLLQYGFVFEVTMAAAPASSFYQRVLPEDCIAFSSPEGRQLLIEALPSSAAYFPIAEQFHTQVPSDLRANRQF